ncbi:MAG: hypothetical protein GX103_07080, partial [Bacteroidales bacterium]|nr:hypothetical protein [Bacteroidales bacterium]
MGEAAVMRNFKVTKDGSLQLRAGSRNVAGLIAQYTISVDDEATTIATDLNSAKSSFTAYPSVAVSDGGILSLSGESVTVNASTISTYEGYYYQDNDGKIYQIGEIEEVVPAGGVAVTGGKVTIASNETLLLQIQGGDSGTISGYDSLKVVSGEVQTDGTLVTAGLSNAYGNYHVKDGAIYQISRFFLESVSPGVYNVAYYGNKVTFLGDNQYKWNFYKVSATTTSTDKAVRGIWSGYVGGTEYIVAAANGNLWSLTEEDGVWTKSNIGAIDTENPVHFFGYDENLYMLNGDDYKVWDGETFKSVVGYRPLVSVSNTPSGGGTALEQVNKLNGLRRAWFSPDGEATVFQLPETGISSVDYVKYRANDTEIDFTANTATGEVTVTGSTPANGTNTIEIGWTVSDTDKDTVTGMMFSEIYSGASDSRVFLYGDGSNMAIYSGLDYDGKPTAEYFPDLNVIHVGESNTPITGLLRHFDRLMAFKQDSAYSISYDTITLVDGTVTAGFYVQTINKGLGNTASGQAQLVENYPRTLDG